MLSEFFTAFRGNTIGAYYVYVLFTKLQVDKDGRVGHPRMATAAMYGSPGPGKYEIPVIPDAPESTK